jgi:MFS family permease
MAPVQIRKYDPCDIFRMENIAIPLSYFSIGFAESFLTTPLNIYMVNVLNAEPPIQSTMTILQTLPWSMKLLFGFISDAVPIAGAHRKPYLVMGSILYSGAFILYALVAAHSTSFLAACIFMGTVGLIQMDVMTDTMVVERSKFEKEAVRGQMQASCYAIRFGGSVVGAVLGAGVCNQETWGWGLDYKQVSFVNGLVPFLIVAPFLFQ